MKFKELFDNPLFLLPKTTPNEKDYLGYIEELFDTYLKLIEKISDTGKITGISKTMTIDRMVERQRLFSTGIKDAIQLYFNGKPSESYLKLSETINTRIERNKQMFRVESYGKGESFYRMRQGKDNFLYSKDQMFHIPFQDRGNVSTKRFSIPGFPSLYLGKTVYVCWEELNRPDVNAFQVSRLKNLKVLKFIDLTPPDLNEVYNAKAFGYIMIWPLIAACSIKVSQPSNYFKPEYIVPQLLLQWVRNRNDVDGIRYSSTHIKSTSIKRMGEYYNMVFPVKENGRKGLCPELIKCFDISDPVSWQSIQIATGGDYNPATDGTDYLDKKLPHLSIYGNVRTRYSHSLLGRIEYYLDNIPTGSSI